MFPYDTLLAAVRRESLLQRGLLPVLVGLAVAVSRGRPLRRLAYGYSFFWT
jgi:hypothetical protein